ncbi:hypothetical protein FNF27_08069 [Cafeteria roenbergensis]|uniref:4-coumarate--CoA ligase n=1 Tax=Cafeteria roenbergensis TaxID=33653 RepID=A0A5A8DQ93_CAFRO|nr:hypothetical protein FNF31_06831 [Cafeteria roenbergensis]KAA0156854.1 hypothetical protein FNF29_00964 [Cafeteria roenbergensis]KAA0162360.1 hypothetical protein FNF27_08069 [Cafeteria roenbergensis]KAA0167552.1 hypothetical protein FNF28_02766 [Cafeteria roenbergensis]|eukprot:KAA0156854.1 hypothetical protein FNF29_00964 [Cafeteria roenbergensis]
MLARASRSASRLLAVQAAPVMTGARTIVFEPRYGEIDVPDLSVTDYLLENAHKFGDKPALIDGLSGRSIKYSELSTRIGSAAQTLVDRGFGPDKTLGIHLPNIPEYIVAFNAAGVAGGRVTTSSPLATASELAHQLRDSSTSTVVTLPAFRETVEAAAEEAGCVKEVAYVGEESGAFLFEDRGIEAKTIDSFKPDDCFALPYSSGTTGLPKGTMLSHRNLVANVQQIVQHPEHNLDMTESDVVLGLLPAYHIYAMTVVCQAALRQGASVVMLPKFEPQPFLEVLQKYGVTWAPLVPPLILFLAKHPVVDSADLSKLRVIFSGAAPLDAGTQSAVEKRLDVSVRQGYGMTELSPVSHFTHPKHNVSGSVGFLAPSCYSKIIDPDTKEELGYGEEGELCVKGPNVMLGYLNNDKATQETILPDGFLRTGDIARVEENGHTFIVDRLKELIKVKGMQVAPAELEGLILECPGVADAAVVPVLHERDGERPKAFVVRAEGEAGEAATEEAVRNAVASKTSAYKHLHEVVFIDHIPKSAAGKILRRMLRNLS